MQRARRPALVMIGSVLLNILGRETVHLLGIPLYLDMLGTAVAAFTLGVWRGVAVALVTNLIGVVVSGPASLPFALVNATGALVWALGARRWGWGRTLPRFLGLNLVTAVACSAVAVPILLARYAGSIGHGQDVLTTRLMTLTDQFVFSVSAANLITSSGDKLISGFVALVIVSALPASYGGAAVWCWPSPAPRPRCGEPDSARALDPGSSKSRSLDGHVWDVAGSPDGSRTRVGVRMGA
ncbi:hypothetical protein [Nocardioides daphniae]|uniref:ECF transporter S component n=1 Tax=Nocardioides daphniae TaxID=402297 RepID=A0A4P7U8N2_9ACTN|nr:hypothetical protein [Nocardioides daphniae]QCC76502.1 hypothetical protein E2C04_03420 [Nocardioides daphniae]GGD06090.1 hypothetical protein GCM10007231_01000 [Nocardioides daphniae]